MIEIPAARPAGMTEQWPGQYDIFSWLEFVVAAPGLLHVVTTRKTTGMANANFNAWMLPVGDADRYCAVIAILRHQHTFTNILREREWCVNIPRDDQYDQLLRTVQCGPGDDGADELAHAGFTAAPAQSVAAPRMAEAGLVMECRLEWDRPLLDGSRWHLFCGRVTHVAMQDAVAAENPQERLRALMPMYNIHNPLNPRTLRHGGDTHIRLA